MSDDEAKPKEMESNGEGKGDDAASAGKVCVVVATVWNVACFSRGLTLGIPASIEESRPVCVSDTRAHQGRRKRRRRV